MKKTHQNNFGKKAIWVLLFALGLFFSPVSSKEASVWIDTVIPKFILPPMDEMLRQLNYIITGAAKQAAVKVITQNVYGIIGGQNGGGAMFIVNWQTALITNPIEEAAAYIDELSTRSTQMMGTYFYTQAAWSSYGMAKNFEGVGKEGLAQYFQSPQFIESAQAQTYSSSSANSLGGSGSYSAELQQIAKDIASEKTSPNKCVITYTGNPENMFEDGTFKKFSLFMTGVNNPWSYANCIEYAYEEKREQLEKIYSTRAMAYQGFTGTEQDGNTTYPGILAKELVANAEDLGNKVIASANGVAEVIVSSVMNMAMNAIQNGIGNIQAQVQRGVSNVSSKANSQTQNQIHNYGPGALYGNSSKPTSL